ncbi:MAG: phosphoribosylglycinamide formyltransferase [Prevotellaceae bacterium]|jgi:phosphoribosylglycinamide formyltransferase-1|nr:phosphoribosylglycinamide formyltransferase [Prevotellaceae bacterium]
MKHRIAILASGNGSNAENIIRHFAHAPVAEVALVITNREKAFVRERARSLHVPDVYLPQAFWKDKFFISSVLDEHNIDFIVLAGFLLRIPSELVREYHCRMVNIHPSLLPKYGGQGMYGDRVHEAVIAAGEAESGITIHYVNDEYDKGDIIFQATCPVLPGDTPHDLAQRIHELEHQHYPAVIEKLLESLPR